MARVVVAGASMAGLRAAETVAKQGFRGDIVVVGAESAMPYNRPPLSKGQLAEPAALAFRIPPVAADVRWRLNTAVVAADLDNRRVTLTGGEQLGFDGLVVATGLRPRRLALPGPERGRHVLRNYADARELYAAIGPGCRLVIVGAGFIGCEVATTARDLGADVVVVGQRGTPSERPLGALVGAELQRRHESRGVRFRLGVQPVELRGEDRVRSVLLSDGSELPADVLVEAIGCVPNVEWLAGNGLDLSDGVRCDNLLRVQGRPGVVACGDVARFPNPLIDSIPRRVEHWTMATDTARRAGASLAGWLAGAEPSAAPFVPLPSFWSDQCGIRVQAIGAVGLAEDSTVLEGNLEAEAVIGYHRAGRLIGVVLLGMAGRQLHYRQLLANQPATTG
ncbi:MAG: FAD-dependent oxidoreductase [Actinomycetota bacterium]|nr:FAD-dependent oxidoreductase [Actinomycetota bacterium]MDQ2956535.1 FAD-dependent oxidoreductase [Actinomycetota bacterium]